MARIYSFPTDNVEIDLSELSQNDSGVSLSLLMEKQFSKSRCSEKEKQELLPVFIDLFSLHHSYQDGGRSALEQDISKLRHPFMVEAFQIFLNENSSEQTNKKLSRKLRSCGVSGKALLEKMLIHQAVISMAEGSLPGTTHKLLMDLLDFDDPTCVVDILFEALYQSRPEKNGEIIPFESC